MLCYNTAKKREHNKRLLFKQADSTRDLHNTTVHNHNLSKKFPHYVFTEKKREKHSENCCCSVPRSFIRFGIYCRAYWLESVTSSTCFGLVSTVANKVIRYKFCYELTLLGAIQLLCRQFEGVKKCWFCPRSGYENCLRRKGRCKFLNARFECNDIVIFNFLRSPDH